MRGPVREKGELLYLVRDMSRQKHDSASQDRFDLLTTQKICNKTLLGYRYYSCTTTLQLAEAGRTNNCLVLNFIGY
jgi:hypothetical protein